MSRIDAVLRVRRAQESIAKGELLRANLALREATSRQAQWQASLTEWGTRTGAVEAGGFRSWRSSLQEGNRELVRRSETTAHAAAERTDAMNVVLEASRRVEVLERLEERLVEAELAGELLREQTAIDEIATGTFTRTRS